MKEVLYLVVPCYNEEEVLHETAKRLLEKINVMIKMKLYLKKVRFYLLMMDLKIKLGALYKSFMNKITFLVVLIYQEIRDIKMHC